MIFLRFAHPREGLSRVSEFSCFNFPNFPCENPKKTKLRKICLRTKNAAENQYFKPCIAAGSCHIPESVLITLYFSIHLQPCQFPRALKFNLFYWRHVFILYAFRVPELTPYYPGAFFGAPMKLKRQQKPSKKRFSVCLILLVFSYLKYLIYQLSTSPIQHPMPTCIKTPGHFRHNI